MEASFQSLKKINLKKLFKFELKFYKALLKISKHTKLYLNIPLTIIYGFGFKTPALLYTDSRSGELLIKENLTSQSISYYFSLFALNKSHLDTSPIALCKTNHDSPHQDKNHLLFTTSECQEIWTKNISENIPQLIQKYIKNISISIYDSEYSIAKKIKTYLLRKNAERDSNKSTIFRKHAERTKHLLVKSDKVTKALVAAPAVDSKMMYLVYLIEKYFFQEYNIKISLLKCNWIEDINGKMYLLNLKQYKITSNFVKEISNVPARASATLPTLSFVKKLKDVQDKSRIMSISVISSSGWTSS